MKRKITNSRPKSKSTLAQKVEWVRANYDYLATVDWKDRKSRFAVGAKMKEAGLYAKTTYEGDAGLGARVIFQMVGEMK